jgi:protein-S-isoprenylcysteine O-methyltransferase Ste14
MIHLIGKASIVLGGLFLLVQQGWLFWRMRRDRRPIERPRSWQQYAGIGLVALGSAAFVLIVLDYGTWRLPQPVSDLANALGVLLFGAGLVLRAWVLQSLGRSYAPDLRITPESTLVTSGAFAWVRHPFYLSAMLLILGAGLALLNAIVLVGVLPLWCVLRSRIRVEERMLLHHFCDAYRDYQQRVPMLWPRLARRARLPEAAPGEPAAH